MSDYRRHRIPTGRFWCEKHGYFTMHLREFKEMGKGECKNCREERLNAAKEEEK